MSVMDNEWLDRSSFLVNLQHSLLVKFVDLRPVKLLGLVALDLHGVGEDASVYEGLGLKVNILGLFEALQSSFLADLCQILDELTPDGLVSAQVLVVSFDFEVGCELFDKFAVRHSDGNHEGFSGVSVDEDFCELVALHVSVFHLFSSYVLTLLQLEDVLLSIYDAHRFGLCAHCSYVTGLQPSISRDGLLSLLLIVVIAQEDSWSSCPNLTPWSRETVLINIS